jgi:hypothetical protein
MSFLSLHRDKKHKYKKGYWKWQDDDEEVSSKLKFYPHTSVSRMEEKEQVVAIGLDFADHIDETEEKIFREIFQRPNSFYDSDVITIQDVKNLALFILKTPTSSHLIDLLHTSAFDEFLHATIFYIDLFLLTLELLLIRRDETLSEGKVRDTISMRVERNLSRQLSHRRLLMAREYSKILLQSASDLPQSMERKRPKLTAEKDLILFESLIDFTIQCTFIAMHRRAFNAICEFQFHFSTSPSSQLASSVADSLLFHCSM